MTDPSNPILYPEWQHAYYAALVDVAPQKLPELVASAETAIFKRLQTMSTGEDSLAERQPIEDALAMAVGIKHDLDDAGRTGRREMKAKTKIRLLAMSKAEREKRLDELNQKLGITQPQKLIESDPEEIEEREWLKKKLGYKRR